MTATRSPNTVEKVHEALGVKLFKPPPQGFDPLRASDRELRVYGYPARPDAKRHPELLALWERALSAPITVVVPQFSVSSERRHIPRARGISNDTSANWSGSVAFAPSGDAVGWVIGQWTVPHVSPPGGGFYYSSAWVGIDGDGSPDVLQAGTEQDLLFLGADYTYAWWEWFPDYEVPITNLHVSPGDVMFCGICVDSPTEASFYLLNVTTRQATSFRKSAPGTTSLVGNCAEWIVERPEVNGHLTSLPRYGDVYFDEAFAGTRNGTILNGGLGTPMTMVEDGRNVSVPVFENNELIRLISNV